MNNLWERAKDALRDCADELAFEVGFRYAATKDHPAMKWRYERDMEPVVKARAVLADMKRVECVDPESVSFDDGYTWFRIPNIGRRPALLLLLEEVER